MTRLNLPSSDKPVSTVSNFISYPSIVENDCQEREMVQPAMFNVDARAGEKLIIGHLRRATLLICVRHLPEVSMHVLWSSLLVSRLRGVLDIS